MTRRPVWTLPRALDAYEIEVLRVVAGPRRWYSAAHVAKALAHLEPPAVISTVDPGEPVLHALSALAFMQHHQLVTARAVSLSAPTLWSATTWGERELRHAGQLRLAG